MHGGEEGEGDLEENPPFLFYDEKGMTIHQYLQGLKKDDEIDSDIMQVGNSIKCL